METLHLDDTGSVPIDIEVERRPSELTVIANCDCDLCTRVGPRMVEMASTGRSMRFKPAGDSGRVQLATIANDGAILFCGLAVIGTLSLPADRWLLAVLLVDAIGLVVAKYWASRVLRRDDINHLYMVCEPIGSASEDAHWWSRPWASAIEEFRAVEAEHPSEVREVEPLLRELYAEVVQHLESPKPPQETIDKVNRLVSGIEGAFSGLTSTSTSRYRLGIEPDSAMPDSVQPAGFEQPVWGADGAWS